MDDVVHKVSAVGSRSVAKAQEFIDNSAHGDKSIKAYGTYEEVYADTVGPWQTDNTGSSLTKFTGR